MNPDGSWTHGANGPHVQLKLKYKKKEKRRKITFSPIFGGGHELERERRETPHSLYDLRRSGGWNPSSQDLKFIYLMRATCGYRQHAISLKI